MATTAPVASQKTTQDFVPIQEVRDGIVVLKDGTMRAIVLASAINFSLKSADEQNSIIYQFQNFLNSLDFSVQIFIQSKKMDIRPYIALLENRYNEQSNEQMKLQVQQYIEFVQKIGSSANIMTKSFFVVIPYMPPPLAVGSNNPVNRIFGKKGASTGTVPNEAFEEYRSQLEQRVSVVEQGLVSCGVRVAELGTEEVVELFYKIFNPGETEKPIQIN
jgi:type IV secretory pathway VirB4 component